MSIEDHPSERGTFLPRISVRRPVTVIMVFLALFVLGIISYINIPRQLLPSGFTPPFLFVQIPTRPSTPKDNEEAIAIKVEEAFGTVRNVQNMRSWVNTSRVGFLLEFKDGTDMDVAYTQIRDRLDRVIPDLPTDLGNYFIWKYNPNNEPIFWIGAALPENLKDEDAAWLLDERLVKRLERVPGVSRVQVEGAPERTIRIEVDNDRANAAGIGTYRLVQQLQDDNFAVAAGLIEEGKGRYPLRVVARFENLDQVRDLPVGKGMLLRDVATVGYFSDNSRDIYRINGEKGVIVQVYKESSANTIEVCDAVSALVHSKDPELSDFKFIDFFNQGFHIQESLENLQTTAFWGGLFAVIVLFFFLRQVGITLVITMAIPASVLMTLVVMYFTGSSLNALTMMGLMLSVGMVVDNSIVVVENIQRVRQNGLDARSAAIYGAGEVALAIVVATSTSIVVFLPLILMSGSETLSFYLSNVGYPVCLSLLASLAVGLVCIPLATTSELVNTTPKAQLGIIKKMEDRFADLLDRCLRRRADTLVVALVLSASIFWPMSRMMETDTNAGNPNDFRIFANFESDVTWDERDDYLRTLDETIRSMGDEIGVRDVLTRMGGGWGRGRLRVFLKSPEDRKGLSKEEIIDRAKEALPKRPGVSLTTSWAERSGDSQDTIKLNLMGPDSQRLEKLAGEVAWRLKGVEGIVDIELQTEDEATQELHMRVQRELSQQRGMTPMIIGATVGFALQGRRLNNYHAEDREVSMVVISNENDREDLPALQRMALNDPAGGAGIPLSELTTSSFSPAYRSINRENRNTLYELTLTTASDDLAKIGESIDAALASYAFPRGYSMSKGARFERLQTNKDEQSFALIMAVICVFLLMGVLFESFLLPLSIVVSIPFAFVGVYWLLYLTNTSFDVMAGIGLIILVGLVVNNAVVLIDLVGVLRRQGMSRHDALVEAGRKRLRPIIMTALTTIFGLLPMAMGSASIVGVPYAPLGRALIGGLTASTLLTLLVVPLCYTLFDDLRVAGTRLTSRLVQSPSKIRDDHKAQ